MKNQIYEKKIFGTVARVSSSFKTFIEWPKAVNKVFIFYLVLHPSSRVHTVNTVRCHFKLNAACLVI